MGRTIKALDPDTIVGVSIGILVISAAVPVAITQILNVSTTSWSAGARAIWNMLDLIIAAGILVALWAGLRGKK